jgi:uncharacterized membrane protein YgcG
MQRFGDNRGLKVLITAVVFFTCLLTPPLLAPRQCLAQERITSFDSHIEISKDSSITITETIAVVAEGREIKRGIYRWLPTRYDDHYGNTVMVEYEILGVQRDGRPEPYHVVRESDHIKVYFGKKSVFLEHGPYTYTFSYRTNRQIGYFDGFDELYWNVTGSDWAFRIEQASCLINLPQGVPVLQKHAYTGRHGEAGTDYTSGVDEHGQTWFRTTRALSPGEGLTIAVSWPKGVVHEPTASEKAGYLLSDNLDMVVGLGGLLVVFIYFFVAWLLVGKDPQPWTIIPLFAPPKDFSPAATRFVTKMGFDNKAFAAAIISMAVKGHLRIEDEGKTYLLTRLNDDYKKLSSGERALTKKLFGSRKTITLKQENHGSITRARRALRSALKREHEKVMFKTNIGYLLPGLVLSLLTLVFIALSRHGEDRFLALFMTVWLSGWSVGCFFLTKSALDAWKGRRKLQAIGPTFMALVFLVTAAGGMVAFVIATSFLTLICLVGLVGLNILFYQLLKAPTFAGRRIMDEIEGFKMFLSISEQERLELLNPPERTPELFERFLPHALALDVENSWSNQFSNVLAQAGVDGQTYRPSWYHGSSWNRLGAAGFAGALGGSLSSALASAATAPGSSSGSGGGGFSGGGGGGGGGGGW